MLQKPSAPEGMSTKEIVQEVASNASLLVQRQIKLATLESKRQASKEKTMAEFLGVAGVFLYAGVIVLCVAGALALGIALDHSYWAGALIVGAGLVVIALILAPVGWAARAKQPLGRTRRELEREISWAKSQLT